MKVIGVGGGGVGGSVSFSLQGKAAEWGVHCSSSSRRLSCHLRTINHKVRGGQRLQCQNHICMKAISGTRHLIRTGLFSSPPCANCISKKESSIGQHLVLQAVSDQPAGRLYSKHIDVNEGSLKTTSNRARPVCLSPCNNAASLLHNLPGVRIIYSVGLS